MKRAPLSARSRAVMASAALALAAGCTSACPLTRVAIDPIADGRTDVFAGRSENVEVRFVNARRSGTVDVFPEPPLTVTNARSKTTCEIDGGVWVRQAVYISRDERVLMTQEFSGSSDTLNFYDTRTCKRTQSLDVSGAGWRVDGDRITLTPKGTRGAAADYRLDTDCKLIR